MNEEKKVFVSSADMFGPMKELLDAGYDTDFTVTGNSMWPLFSHGRDRVVIRKQIPKKGDIILYSPTDGVYLLHRVNKIKDGVFVASGDANCFYDGRFSVAAVIGTVVRFYRKNKLYEADAFCVRLYGAAWTLLFPVRRPLLWLGRKLASLRK